MTTYPSDELVVLQSGCGLCGFPVLTSVFFNTFPQIHTANVLLNAHGPFRVTCQRQQPQRTTRSAPVNKVQQSINEEGEGLERA